MCVVVVAGRLPPSLSGEITASFKGGGASPLVSLLAVVSSVIFPVAALLRAASRSQRWEAEGVITVVPAVSVLSAGEAVCVALWARRVVTVMAPASSLAAGGTGRVALISGRVVAVESAASVLSAVKAARVASWRAAAGSVPVGTSWIAAGMAASREAVVRGLSLFDDGGVGAPFSPLLPASGGGSVSRLAAAASVLQPAPAVAHSGPAVLVAVVVGLHESRGCVFFAGIMCRKKCLRDGLFLQEHSGVYWKYCSNK